MANVEGVREAVFAFMDQIDPDARAALLLQASELAFLHYLLEVMQEHFESADTPVESLLIFGLLRNKVEAVLCQAGYGGDPRAR